MLRDAEFHTQSIELYRPLQNMSYIIDSQWVGVNSKSFHFSNLMIHLLTIIMLFLLLGELGLGKGMAFIGALIYAVHPVVAYTVAWIPSRGDLLLGFFGLTTIYFYIKFLKDKNYVFLWLHFLGFAFALLTKESAVMIPIIVWFYLILVVKKFKIDKVFFLQATVYLILTVIYLYMRSLAITSNAGGNLGLTPFFENLPSLPETILKFFVPVNIVLLPFYDTARTLAGSIILLGLIAWFAKTFKIETGLKIWGLIWLLILILPGMAYNPNWSEYIYSYLIHRSYFPFMGLFIFVLFLLKPIIEKQKTKTLAIIITPLFIALMALNVNFSAAFSSPKNFWQKAVETNPKSAFSNAYLGNAYMANHQLSKAIQSYDKALKIKPDLKAALINRGVCKLQINQIEGAIEDLKAYLKIDSNNFSAEKYLAEAYYKNKNYKNAIILYNKLNNKSLMDDGMKFNYGMSLFFTENYDEAYKNFKPLAEAQTDNINLIRVYSLAALMSGNTWEAIAQNELLVQKESKNLTSLCNLGYAYWEGEQFYKALSSFKKAAKISHKNIDVNLGLSLCYFSLHQKDNLKQSLQEIYRTKPALKNNSNGISYLQREGFLFTEKQKEILKTILLFQL